MKEFYYYSDATGAIVERHTGPAGMLTWERKPGFTLGVAELGSLTPDSYVIDGELATRPFMPIIRDGMILRNVRSGATVTIEGTTYMCDGTPVELTFSYEGVYEVVVKDWPYIDWSGQFENRA